VHERRARLGRRHHLAAQARAVDVTDVARRLVGLHSTDPATVFLAAAARLVEPKVTDIERALYDDRSLVRMIAMRRTMWVVPVESVPMVEAACAQAIAVRERKRLVKLLADTGIAAGDTEAWLTQVETATLAALDELGAAFGAELSAAVPALRSQFTYAEGKAYGGTQTIATQVLSRLSMAGRIARGRPRGAWNSSQYRWAPMTSWLPGGVADMDPAAAKTALVEAWLRAFGPGTLTDLRWWTGLTLGEIRKALVGLDVVEVDLDGAGAPGGASGVLLADDVEPVAAPGPWIALLPALDPTPMGWTERDWYLGDHRALLFDRSGNIGPTVWCNGRIVGGWAQRKMAKRGADGDGEVVVRLFEDIGADQTAAVTAAAERLTAWIGDVRVTPRFRTPLERELSA
jgi:Winged helix DNA-binding domain